jgi:hypothetical protein
MAKRAIMICKLKNHSYAYQMRGYAPELRLTEFAKVEAQHERCALGLLIDK